MSVIPWSIVLAKIDLVSLYFHLLWYHSVLKGSIDQYSKVHSPLACSRWLPWFPDLFRSYVACVKRGSGETYVQAQSLSSESAVKSIPTSVPVRRRKIQISPPPREQDFFKCPTPGPTKTIKSPPHALLPPLPPTGFTLISTLANSFGVSIPYHFLQRWKSTITTSFTDKSPAGDQLWNSGRQYWIFSCIGDQEGTISDPDFDHLDAISMICVSQVDIGKLMWSKGSWEMCWLHPSIATSCKLSLA